MKAKELRERKIEELDNLLKEKKIELCQLRFELKANQVQNKHQLKMVRREIARIETIKKENNKR